MDGKEIGDDIGTVILLFLHTPSQGFRGEHDTSFEVST